MQRYFVRKIEDNRAYLSPEDSYHFSVVMRGKTGEEVEIVCGERVYIGKAQTLDKSTVVQIEKETEANDIPYSVSIAQALIKDKKMDYVLQKATELGVDEIIPLITKRSIVKVEQKQDKKIERWQKIVREASSQSKRIRIPIVQKVTTLQELIQLDYDVKILCSVNESSISIKKVLDKLDRSDKILFVVGAEGGFEPSEEELLIQHGFVRVSLGSNVLRTETTPLYLLSVVSYNFMR